MDINNLYEKAIQGGTAEEAELFRILTVRFRIIAGHRIRNNEDAEDVVQECLAIIYREYREIAFHSSFAAWAYEVLKHRMLSHFEKRDVRSRRRASLEEADLQVAVSAAEEGTHLRSLLIECLRRIAKRNVRYARILNLQHQGFETEEICERLGISPGNFYLILFRARAWLDQCLREKGYHGREM